MKPLLFLLFVALLASATLMVRGCMTGALDPTAVVAKGVRSTEHSIVDNSLGSIPYFGPPAKPSPAVTANGTPSHSEPNERGVARTARDGSLIAVYHSPETNLESVDKQYLVHVEGHLDIAMYSFTDQHLAEVVCRLATSGVRVRIYRDSQQYTQEVQEHAGALQILSSCPNIQMRVKSPDSLMHLKSWTDGRMLRDGSANWSSAGEMQQDNTLLLITDVVPVSQFGRTFDKLWNRTSNTRVR